MDEQTIRPWPVDPPPEESLPSVLERVNTKYGTFRSLNEDALAQDKQALGEAIEDLETEEVAEKSAREKFFAQRRELAQLVSIARHEVLVGLDFVSLLLSRDLPEQGKSSMSPVLKTSVPTASLGFDRWDMSHSGAASSITIDAARKQLSVARGQRLRNISSAVKSLQSSADRLRGEIDREQTYWQDVVAIRQKGWPIRRMVPGKSVLGVQAGSLEAGPQFRTRGFTVLRRKQDGHVQLEGAGELPLSQIRTRVMKNDTVLGSSQASIPSSIASHGMGLEGEILRIRDSLFDEELFYEIVREARTLHFRNVTLRDDSVSFSTCGDGSSGSNCYELVIDMVPLEGSAALQETTEMTDTRSQPGLPLDKQADSINLLFRLLMARTYTRRLQRRTRIPDPIGDVRRRPLTTSILRPLVARLHSVKLSDGY